VVEDESIWSFVTEHMRKTLGLEMEAAAIGALAQLEPPVPLPAASERRVMP
jgi:hypothetical protein